ncbi:hypothetical protein [Sphingomonas paucimobilis]|uniref:hypothetical protein n=1 Tax=Sphingomonas paucimobilis TaxID=13689 RepID=UPI00203C604E|nr:hypothetical protein [Sphingomonas paucimobilis]MCM3679494.1 hypothetical protein [Sphingomonas paucimobilis]
MREPWDFRRGDRWRLGLRLGKDPSNATSSALGWAAISLGKARPMSSGRLPSTPDEMVDRVLTQVAIHTRQHGEPPESLDLYLYGNDQCFLESAACAEGMSRADHEAMVRRVARTLRAEGHTVRIRTVR